MLIGAMNNPANDPLEEMRWMAELGLDFIDLTLEPPAASVTRVDARTLRTALGDLGLKVVGHTAYYLPLSSPFDGLRRAAVDEAKRCLELFAALGAEWMNVHPDGHAPFQERQYMIRRNLLSLETLIDAGRSCGVGVMIENLPGKFNNAAQLADLLEPYPDLGLHLDIGHCNLMVEYNTAGELLQRFGARLRHVHLHDNKGGHADLHLPLGTGTLDVQSNIEQLVRTGYDRTITLEVFSSDHWYLAHSRDVLRRCWEQATERIGRPQPVTVTA